MIILQPELALFAASQIGTPGPANMVLLSAGARFGLLRSLPFVAGVALGKQLILWPIGFGLLLLAQMSPWIFTAFKTASVVYILYLAWRIANMRLSAADGDVAAPGFFAGLIVHPLNPKAWAMLSVSFTTFVPPGADLFAATLQVAITFVVIQFLFHPLWCASGQAIARVVAGTRGEKWLMWVLAALTVASVLYALLSTGSGK
jgi:threonine/homoserine/homoserine lactone efflux protein